MNSSAVLVTGGAGYIGSHTVVSLLEAGRRVVIVDNFSNSCPEVLNRIQSLTNKPFEFVELDLLDTVALDAVFQQSEIESVIHFAGLKAVSESVREPHRYYQNNVEGSLNLFRIMRSRGCMKLVFSSSATVYGDPASVPVREDFPLSATNPYGQSKLMVETILRDICAADSRWAVTLLRYFNPVGAHPSGKIGEDPNGIPNNLMPYIAQVGVGKLSSLSVFGDDYPTPDGTGVRDYIHVMDLAAAHLKALDMLSLNQGCRAYNIGTGQGYSVLEMIRAFEDASGRKISFNIKPRRAGDIAVSYADPALSQQDLGWQAEYGLTDMMQHQWNWQQKNPDGYQTSGTN